MKQKRILLVSYAFPPVFSPGAVRVERFAHYLSTFGHDVTVLTCSNPYSSMMAKKNIEEAEPGYKIIRTRDLVDKTAFSDTGRQNKPQARGLKTHLKRALARVFSFLLFPDRDLTWMPTAFANLKNNQAKYDVVLGSYPGGTNLVVACYVAKKLDAKLVIDLRDLWTQKVPAKKYSFGLKLLENYVIKNADLILNVSEHDASIMRAAWPDKSVATIYNGYDAAMLPARQKDKPGSRFVMTYAGSFYGGERDPRALFKAMADLQKNGILTPENFVFNILGNIEPVIQSSVKNAGVQDLVVFQGLKTPSVVYQALASSNLLLTITRSTSSSGGEMTTKLFEYIGVGRRIFCLTKPSYEIAKVLGKINGSIVVDVDNKSEIVNGLELALNSWLEAGRTNTHFDNGSSFSRENQAQRLSCEIQQL